MTKLETLQHELLDLFTSNKETITGQDAPLLNEFRASAFDDFKRLGIPTKKHENYKYTNLESYLTGPEYSYELAPLNFEVNLDDLFHCDIPELATRIALVLNGFYYKHNRPVDLPEGVILCGLAEASREYPELIKKHYGKYAKAENDSLVALNTMFAQDGVFLYIPKNVVLDTPIQIINIAFSLMDLRITRRNLIIVEDSAQGSVLFCDHTLCGKSFITNSLTEIYVGENTNFDLTRLQNENGNSTQISNTFIHQEGNSNLTTNTLSLHGGLIRNNTYAKLNGENSYNNTYGLFLSDGNQHMSTFTNIHHAKPHCTSDQLVKGILNDTSTGAFNGKIYVDKGAIKTEAYQRNNNILLSKTAKMNTKPQLEIYNDDVKCSHGATIGQLDTNALFYIRSRGIVYEEARHLLMYAFANEVIGKIKLEALRERMIDMVDRRLRGELGACENCKIIHN
ncbi:MAG: Fe-S cluster assembly protein SufD [Bacteroidales bacterium]|nr:Fe-S cluster assembly protein SufD [Bacteroidales bacterium]MBN2817724.1 Fe-S cluster assembly protein SufD [Bacteroidales bacterium]